MVHQNVVEVRLLRCYDDLSLSMSDGEMYDELWGIGYETQTKHILRQGCTYVFLGSLS